ncbi:hypothetical protein FOPG_13000, partial [Fusarium oxysporum f. sp. conglutinans race 2 54008]
TQYVGFLADLPWANTTLNRDEAPSFKSLALAFLVPGPHQSAELWKFFSTVPYIMARHNPFSALKEKSKHGLRY